MSEITIRPYRNTDWSAIEEIHDAARRMELHLAKLDAAFVPLSIAAQREGLFDYTVDVAELNGAVMGFVAYAEGELAWLYVRPELMRHGIGSALTRHAVECMPEDTITLEALCGNEPARRLYEKTGFAVTCEESGHMPGNEEFEVSVYCMELHKA